MDNIQFEVEDKDIRELFKNLKLEDRSQFQPAFQKAVDVLKEEGISQLQKVTQAWDKPNKKYQTRPYENIISKAWKEGNAAFVHIKGMGRTSGTGFLLNWFEGGTKKRYRYEHYKGRDAIGRWRTLRRKKETGYTGKMARTEFFSKAYQSKGGKALDTLATEIKRIIDNVTK